MPTQDRTREIDVSITELDDCIEAAEWINKGANELRQMLSVFEQTHSANTVILGAVVRIRTYVKDNADLDMVYALLSPCELKLLKAILITELIDTATVEL